MITIPKEDNIQLCFGLKSSEFKCKCGFEECRGTFVSKKLVKAYSKFRSFIDTPLEINSGFRCVRHNFDIGGVPLSRHCSGEAIDISLSSFEFIDKDEVSNTASFCGFTFIKFYKTFVHFDVR